MCSDGVGGRSCDVGVVFSKNLKDWEDTNINPMINPEYFTFTGPSKVTGLASLIVCCCG